jgi:hypothetical protein
MTRPEARRSQISQTEVVAAHSQFAHLPAYAHDYAPTVVTDINADVVFLKSDLITGQSVFFRI